MYIKQRGQKTLVIVVVSLIFTLVPATIIPLFSSAQEDEQSLLAEDPAYQKLEQQLTDLQSAEEQKLEEIKTIETAPAVSPKSPPLVVSSDASAESVAIVDSSVSTNNDNSSAETVSVLDPAIAPGETEFQILMPDGQAPNFPLEAQFVAVGGKKIKATSENGKFAQTLITGRYYVEIISPNKKYVLRGDGPAFYLLPGETKNLGDYYLKNAE
jgi:ABC-type Na+ efflux pump permease subunit